MNQKGHFAKLWLIHKNYGSHSTAELRLEFGLVKYMGRMKKN